MVRSMYSGVAGMKAHQTRMDVIGNNIANVNTYGFKGSRATFRDVYYQTNNTASGGTGAQGGINPSQVGYGTQVGSVDVIHTRSSFAMTDNGMDVAIAGEGYFQVQDGDGNTFYTRAGLLSIDSAGNVVDMSGNFVLGVSDNPLGQAASADRISISVPSVDPSSASATQQINGATINVTTTNATKDGNVGINFVTDDTLPLGQAAVAEMTTSGITVRLNKNETFINIDALNTQVNSAIINANGGEPHPAGVFTIAIEPATKFPVGGLTGEEIASNDFRPKLGDITIANSPAFGSISFKEVGTKFEGNGAGNISLGQANVGGNITITTTINGVAYTGLIPANATTAGTVKLSPAGGDPNDYIILNHGGHTQLEGQFTNAGGVPVAPAPVNITGANPTVESKNLGFNSKPIKLFGGTLGGPQTVADLSSIGISQNGIIEGIHSVHGRLQLGRIDIVTFSNPQGLEQAGSSYFKATANSGEPKSTIAGTDGSGALAAGSLEMSNVDLSREFSDMITTQRGFQANSRLITVSDEMLNELVNLKR
ncbi:MAG: flagellar hook protein FlgE [Oscillospiraceae bacterium]